MGTYDLFTISIVGTCMGACSVFSRASSIVSPFVAELHPEEIGEITFVSLALLALVFSCIIVLPRNMQANLDDYNVDERVKSLEKHKLL